MKSILITGIGGDIAQSVAKIIRQKSLDYQLIGTDTHNDHAGSLFVDNFFQLPFANEINYQTSFEDLLSLEKIDIVMPMTEPELAALALTIKKHTDIDWVTAGEKVITAGLDKLATIDAIKKLGVLVPWTLAVKGGKPLAYPCILKNRFGSGSRAVFIVKDAIEASYLAERYPDAVYQELLEPADNEITCAVYRTRDGKTGVLQMLRRLAGGFTGWAKIINEQSIGDMCITIAEGLDLRGAMNIQLRMTSTGPRVFEINPRFSSTVLMRHLLGFSDVVWALDEINSVPIEFPIIASGQIVVRTQDAAILNS